MSPNNTTWDPSSLRLDNEGVKRSQGGTRRGRRASPIRGKFIAGPIDVQWVVQAKRVGATAQLVGLALWHLKGLRRSDSFIVSNLMLQEWGVRPDAKSRALRALERAGLIRVERRGKRSPQVTLIVGSKASKADASEPGRSSTSWRLAFVDLRHEPQLVDHHGRRSLAAAPAPSGKTVQRPSCVLASHLFIFALFQWCCRRPPAAAAVFICQRLKRSPSKLYTKACLDRSPPVTQRDAGFCRIARRQFHNQKNHPPRDFLTFYKQLLTIPPIVFISPADRRRALEFNMVTKFRSPIEQLVDRLFSEIKAKRGDQCVNPVTGGRFLFGATTLSSRKRRMRLPHSALGNGLLSMGRPMRRRSLSRRLTKTPTEMRGVWQVSSGSTPDRFQGEATAGKLTMFAAIPHSTTSPAG